MTGIFYQSVQEADAREETFPAATGGLEPATFQSRIRFSTTEVSPISRLTFIDTELQTSKCQKMESSALKQEDTGMQSPPICPHDCRKPSANFGNQPILSCNIFSLSHSQKRQTDRDTDRQKQSVKTRSKGFIVLCHFCVRRSVTSD